MTIEPRVVWNVGALLGDGSGLARCGVVARKPDEACALRGLERIQD